MELAWIDKAVEGIKSLPIKCAVAAISGGVDSTTAAVLVRRAIGDRLRAVFIDTGFMRLNEPAHVKELLRDVLPIEVIDARDRFYREMLGLSDAEEKRIRFREVFYEVLSGVAREYGCDWLVQGTIAPDWIETRGGIKTQHNVLEQIGIDTVSKYGFKLIEPLRELYKDQVRELAKALGVPSEIVNRQPFPGPGLSIRAVGELTLEKLDVVRGATEIVERRLGGMGLSQWFAAAWEYDVASSEDLSRIINGLGNFKAYVFKVRATGVKGDSRSYGNVVLVRGDPSNWGLIYDLYRYLGTARDVTHVVYELMGRGSGKYFVSIRAVLTEDFMTADVARIPQDTLMGIAQEILGSDERVAAVGYDVTPKPPATIEYE
ncbi:ATP-binding protein [Vulcanisaeta distributa]|uniref:GMP synthase (glutamine-hydrolyzing) n=1 Tax=Vulcanisaeta distributa (strain DSM 14429 / JCM 11212 / NBRC 100878 / IC-017) TaxID=572478 RepID=E1QV84_VULDI|nr:ATP-binding protein [Vulcanisaeta distributa]ADN50011.1 GMP synthase (glutamine-hydrolyzing) [Vulcanisaeta distributa DSM 14429]